MFPYYWNGFQDAGPFVVGSLGILHKETPDRDLPEEVKEALENHRYEINAMGDREDFIRRLDMKK